MEEMNITVHQRPGVYSAYDASSVVNGSGGGKMVGLAAVNTVAQAGEVRIITSYDKAVAAFGSAGGQDMAETDPPGAEERGLRRGRGGGGRRERLSGGL